MATAFDIDQPAAKPTVLDEEKSSRSSVHVGRKRGGWITFPFVTVATLGLAVGSTGWSGNLVVFLIKKFNFMSIDAAEVSNIVNGTGCFAPIIGAILADSFFGNFPVIVASFIISLLGLMLFMLTLMISSLRPRECVTNATGASSTATCEAASTLQLAVLYTSLALGVLGVGGTKYILATMGAGQYKKPNDQSSYFNWYFFTTYIGSIIGIVGVIYILDNVGWDWGIGICLVAYLVALTLFLAGKRYYRRTKPTGSPYKSLARVFVATFQKRKANVSSETKTFYHGSSDHDTTSTPTSSLRFLNRAALKTEGDANEDGSIAKEWSLCTVQQVEDLKKLIRIMPLWFSGFFLSIPIGVQFSLLVPQVLRMDRRIGRNNFEFSAGSFTVCTIVASAISVTLIDRFLMPTYRRLIGRPLTPLQRVGIGHVLNIVSMSASAVVERKRLSVVWSEQLTTSTSAETLSAFWLVIPLSIVGVGEAFQLPGQVAFYYQEFPVSLRSTSTAMISLTLAVGFYMSSAMISVVQSTTGWLPNNINQGRLDNMFVLLVVIGVMNFGYFIICSVLYEYQSNYYKGDNEKLIKVENDNQPSQKMP